jgi:hypothetical protein
MRIHVFEGLAPGKCRKSRTFDTCLSPLFTLLKQNAGLRTSIMFPVTGGDRTVTLKKVKGIVLKHFGHTSFTLQRQI